MHFFNATPRPYKLVMTLPNGASETANLTEGTEAITYAYFNPVPAIKEVQIQLVDEAGAAVCSGKASRDVAYTFFSDAQGVKMVPTGTNIQAALFMNSIGEPLTLNLIELTLQLGAISFHDGRCAGQRKSRRWAALEHDAFSYAPVGGLQGG